MCNIGQIQRHAEIIGAAKGILALREIPALEVQIDTNPNIEAKIENLIISITDTEPITRPIIYFRFFHTTITCESKHFGAI